MTSFAELKRQREGNRTKYVLGQLPSSNSDDFSSSKKQAELSLESQNPQISDQIPAGPILLNTGELYASLPPSLDLRTTQGELGNGRGLYSKYLRKPGDVLFSLKPHVAALSNEHLEEYCSNCFAPRDDTLRRCTGCKFIFYCDEKCQNADWRFHKHECPAIQTWVSSSSESSGPQVVPGDAIRCLGRILWRKQKLGQSSTWAREIDGMQSNRTSISKDPNSHDSEVHTRLAHAIVRFLGLNSVQGLAEYGMNGTADLVDLTSRFTTNTFTISTPALTPLGACVSPLVALINHSCDPNAVVVFPRSQGNAKKSEEPLMQVIALKHIKPDEEILTAYIDTTLPRATRQKLLQETYFFECKCRLCEPADSSEIDMREAIFCPKKCTNDGVCPLPTEENVLVRCNKCKAPLKDTDAVLDAIRVGQEALNKAEAFQFSDPQKSIQLATKLIPILTSAGLVPSSHPLLGLSRLNSSLLITHLPSMHPTSPDPAQNPFPTPEELQEVLNDAIRAATRASSGLSLILSEGHPIRGISLAELGKLLTVDEPRPSHFEMPDQAASASHQSISSVYPPSGPARLKFAYKTLLRAREELLIGFGMANKGGEVGKQVAQMMASIEKELSVWTTGIRNVVQDQTTATAS